MHKQLPKRLSDETKLAVNDAVFVEQRSVDLIKILIGAHLLNSIVSGILIILFLLGNVKRELDSGAKNERSD